MSDPTLTHIQSAQPLLEVQTLTFARENQTFDYNFDVNAGEIVAILGSSGSGKTTLAELIAGFEQPSSGDIKVHGKSILAANIASRGVGYVFQNHNLFSHMTVFANLALAFRPSGKVNASERDQIQAALEKVSLAAMADRLPEALSIGQQQRIALARAALKNCQVLLLDEPFSALDPGLRDQMGTWLQTLVPFYNMACLLITHQPDEAQRLAERTVFIHQGSQLLFDNTYKVLQSNDQYVRNFLG